MEFVVHTGGKVKIVFREQGKPDSEVLLSKPKVGMVLDFEKAVDEAQANGGNGGVSLIAAFLVECGMPEAQLRDMDADQMEIILQALVPTKKK